MTLYHTPTTCSLFPLIVLHELGARFEVVRVDLRTRRTEGGDDFLAINPKGKVPALALEDGQVLTEGPAIAQFLADTSPTSALAPPAGTLARARLQEWLNFLTSDVHKSFAVFFQPTAGEAHVRAVRQDIVEHLARLDAVLASQPFLMGEAFSLADAYLFTIVSWAPLRQIDTSSLAHLLAFQERVAQRPSVRAAMGTP
jgi:glutathione S-transferase